jgi:hypothetical protein
VSISAQLKQLFSFSTFFPIKRNEKGPNLALTATSFCTSYTENQNNDTAKNTYRENQFSGKMLKIPKFLGYLINKKLPVNNRPIHRYAGTYVVAHLHNLSMG